MPFSMTHLCIANDISKKLSKNIDSLPQFYLGNLAPDAVHNRANYISDYKKAAHLCVGSESWGMITNNDEWIENVIAFLSKYKNTKNYDFVLGYCTHILSDAYNNITVWTPFKQKYLNELDKGYNGLYHLESEKIDLQLALTIDYIDDIWINLEHSKGIDLEDIIFADEIEKQREKILYHQYKDKNLQDTSLNKVVTYDSTIDFIKNASDFVMVNLQNHFNK